MKTMKIPSEVSVPEPEFLGLGGQFVGCLARVQGGGEVASKVVHVVPDHPVFLPELPGLADAEFTHGPPPTPPCARQGRASSDRLFFGLSSSWSPCGAGFG